MNLLATILPSAARLNDLKEIAVSLQRERDELKLQNTNLWKSNTEAEERATELRAELEKTKSKVRDQTDADLMLISARILFAIAQNKKPEKADVVQQQFLMSQQQAMGLANTANPYSYGMGYAASLLGGSAIFGR